MHMKDSKIGIAYELFKQPKSRLELLRYPFYEKSGKNYTFQFSFHIDLICNN